MAADQQPEEQQPAEEIIIQVILDGRHHWTGTQLIGEGHFANVYKVTRDGQDGRDDLGAAKIANDLTGLQNELALLQRINNQSSFLPSLLDHGLVGGHDFIVFSLEGMDLWEHWLSLGRFACVPPRDIHYFAWHGFKALQNLHSFNILHRDIKPDNFAYGITTGKSEIVLLDLGHAVFVPVRDGVRMYPPADDPLFRQRMTSPRNMERGDHTEVDDIYMYMFSLLTMACAFDVFCPFDERLRKKRALMANPSETLSHIYQYFVPLVTAIGNLQYGQLPDYASIFASVDAMERIIIDDEDHMWI